MYRIIVSNTEICFFSLQTSAIELKQYNTQNAVDSDLRVKIFQLFDTKLRYMRHLANVYINALSCHVVSP